MISLSIFPNPQPPNPAPNPLSLRGGTMTLMIPTLAAVNAANPDPTWVAMTIDAIDPNPVNQFATYIARPGIDFPAVGSYPGLQAKFTAEGGILLLTSAFTLVVTNEASQMITFVLPFMRQRTGWPAWLSRPRNPWA